MNFDLQLSAITWPLVAIFAIFAFKPFLEKHFTSLTKAMEDIKGTPQKLAESITKLDEFSKASMQIKTHLDEIESRLISLSEKQSEVSEKQNLLISQNDDEALQAIQDNQKFIKDEIIKNPTDFDWKFSFEKFKSDWDEFSEFASARLGFYKLPANRNLLPVTIEKMTRKNSKYKFTEEESQDIQYLYTNNRSIRRIKSTSPAEWYTPEYHFDLMARLDRVKQAFDRALPNGKMT